MKLFISFCLALSVTACASFAETPTSSKQPALQNTQPHDSIWFAQNANQQTWALLNQDNLNDDEKKQVLYSAFASAWHWQNAGDEINLQRAERLISHSYSRLNQPENALQHAQNCIELTVRNKKQLKNIDIAHAYEAMSRAMALSGEISDAENYFDHANRYGKKIKDKKTRELFFSDLNSPPWGELEPTQ